MNYFRRFRDAAVCVALLGIPFFFLRANLKDAADTNFIDRLALQASSPLQYVAKEVAHGISAVFEDYVYLVEVADDNQRLRRSNRELRARVRKLRIRERENQRLRELLSLREQLRGETLTARVVGKEITHLFRVIRVRIDRGREDRVQVGMPVLSAQGLVGQIRRSSEQFSDVLLTVDRSSAIDVIIHRTGARGMLRGTGDRDRYACRIQYLQRSDEVEVGDEVYTSGLGQRFPPSILVGRVERVVRRDFGLYQEVEVTPAVDFSSLEEVLILTEGSKEQSAAVGGPVEGEVPPE